jgi:ABC-2 type transport system permease protein
MPLGYNQYERYTFGNKDFLLNCVEYLLDENGIIASRGREFKLRLLDRVKTTEEKSFWQGINIALPLVVLFLFGLIYNYLRKKKYGSK